MSFTNEDIDSRIRVLCDALPYFGKVMECRYTADMGADAWKRIQEIQKEIIALASKFVGQP